MHILNDLQEAIHMTSDDDVYAEYECLINELFNHLHEEDIQGQAQDIINSVNSIIEAHDEEFYASQSYRSYESIYGCPARI